MGYTLGTLQFIAGPWCSSLFFSLISLSSLLLLIVVLVGVVGRGGEGGGGGGGVTAAGGSKLTQFCDQMLTDYFLLDVVKSPQLLFQCMYYFKSDPGRLEGMFFFNHLDYFIV